MSDLAAHPPLLSAEAPRLRLSPSQQFAVLSLAILLLLGSILAWFLSGQIERQMTAAVSDMIGHQVTAMIRSQFTANDLSEPMIGERYRVFDEFLRRNILSRQIARVKVWNEAGTIIYADDPALAGQTFPVGDELREVFAEGDVVADLANLQASEHAAERGKGLLLEILVPLVPRDSEQVLGAYEVYLYYGPIATSVQRAQAWIWGSVAAALGGLWGGLFWVFQRASRAIAHQRRLAITDPLTGLHNRRYLLEQLEIESERSRRYHVPFSLILLDIDHFKHYNDTYGHPAGDTALRELADRIRKCVRALDTVARYGGEEFAVLLPATGPAGAARTAERIRECVAAKSFAHGSLTISLGVACHADLAPSGLIAEADAALYRAKSLGRNQVCLAEKE
jgi:diguanylate cyclase (GGDEF)-like protein